jgi:hypothetical protein
MKKINILAIVVIGLVVLSSCKKNSANDADNTSGGSATEYGNFPRTTIPASLVAQWTAGSFSLTSVVDNNGTWSSEYSVSYVLESNGNCREYFQYGSMPTYGQIIQVRGLRKGSVAINTATKTLKFYAASGWYDERRNFSAPVRHEYGDADLYPRYFREYKYEETTDGQGRPALRLTDENSTNSSGLVYTKL